MSWYIVFKEAYNNYPSQDNEGYVPDRGGFKAGFCSAWDYQQQRIDKLEKQLDTLLVEYGDERVMNLKAENKELKETVRRLKGWANK